MKKIPSSCIFDEGYIRLVYSYFGKVCRKNMHATTRKVIWDMINTLFLTTVAVEPTFVAFL